MERVAGGDRSLRRSQPAARFTERGGWRSPQRIKTPFGIYLKQPAAHYEWHPDDAACCASVTNAALLDQTAELWLQKKRFMAWHVTYFFD
jgi:hypothetical protein